MKISDDTGFTYLKIMCLFVKYSLLAEM